MKAVMISIKPKWVEKIANGQKTIEVRKTRPKIDTPFKCYIYVTKGKPYLYRVDDDDNFELTNTFRPKVYGYVKDYNEQNGKVIGAFVCDKIENFTKAFFDEQEPRDTEEITDYLYQFNMTYGELVSYVGLKNFYGWHISNLVIYDEPKVLGEFFTPIGKRPSYMLERPFQSWCYVEEKEDNNERKRNEND